MSKVERLYYTAQTYHWMLNPRFWWQFLVDSPSSRIDRPIFILGTQGGGLTLLTRMLRRTGTLVSGAGGKDYWTAADEIQNIYGPVFPLGLTGSRWKCPKDPQFIRPYSWCYGSRRLFSQYRRTEADVTHSDRTLLKKVIALSLKFHGRNGESRFIDKSQCYILRLAYIYEILKETRPKFILLPREPYVSVYRAAVGKAADMAALMDQMAYEERIDVCAEHYGNCMNSVFSDADRLSIPIHLCRFEDLISDPTNQLKSICEFCELPFDDDLIPAAHHRLPYGSRFRDRWFPLRSNVNEPYQGKIDSLTIQRVNHYCGDIIERLRYHKRKSVPSVSHSGGT